MPAYTDQTGRTISLDHFPQRIISLVPSQTELLFDLGLDEEVVGITKFCSHPPHWFHSKTRVGGTKKLHLDIIHQIQPDLIIANKEENVKEQIEECARHYPAWISDVCDLSGAYDMIRQLGMITGRGEQAQQLIGQIKSGFAQLPVTTHKPRTAYLIWNDPYMTIGNDTFIHAMLDAAGFENAFGDQTRYPVVTENDLIHKSPDILLLSSEPFPFRQQHIDRLQPLLPHTQIMLADGELFSWYGSRLLHAPRYFRELREGIYNGQ